MSDITPDKPYIYQPYGSVSRPDRAGKLWGIAGLKGLTRDEAERILSVLTDFPIMINAAIAEEREACAKIAEDLSVIDASIDSLAHVDQRLIAAAIRARGERK